MAGLNYYRIFYKGEEIDAWEADGYGVSSEGTLTVKRYTSVGVVYGQYFKGEWDRFTENGDEPHIRGNS